MFHRTIEKGILGLVFVVAPGLMAATKEVTFSQSSESVEAYDFVELTVSVAAPDAHNPFTDAALRGTFQRAGEKEQIAVEGFCDSADGSVFRIRFMPAAPGDYTYSVAFRQGDFEKTFAGKFHATEGHRRGPVRVDRQYPWHFIWEGTGEHYFFNGTTAFWLMGWRDEKTIQDSIDRLHKLKINRMRGLIAGTTTMTWGEPVMTAENFTMLLHPWVVKSPQSFENPGTDFTRYDVAYWQKWERMLRYAREHDMIISAVLDIATHDDHVAAGSEDERRYIRYAVARLARSRI